MSKITAGEIRNNQQGLVSVTVTLVIMIVVTLIVSSFALIVRREQRRTLDRQLSAQAFYAAEAGIADARSALLKNAGAIGDVTVCDGNDSFEKKSQGLGNDSGAPFTNPPYSSNLGDNVSYSCVLINQVLPDYDKQNVDPKDGSFVASINGGSASSINSLRISWHNNDNAPITHSDSSYNLNNVIDGPMLRVTIFPGFNNGGSPSVPLTKSTIENGSHTMFLYPNFKAPPVIPASITYLGANGGVNSTDPSQGQFVDGNCNNDNIGNDVGGKSSKYACNIDITGLGQQEYFVVVQPLYKTAKVSISAYNATGDAINLEGGQAEIDVTGRASDVLRRIKVRVPIDGGLSIGDFDGLFPDAVISTTDALCKKLVVGSTSVLDECTNTNMTISGPPPPPPPPSPPPPPPPCVANNSQGYVNYGSAPRVSSSRRGSFNASGHSLGTVAVGYDISANNFERFRREPSGVFTSTDSGSYRAMGYSGGTPSPLFLSREGSNAQTVTHTFSSPKSNFDLILYDIDDGSDQMQISARDGNGNPLSMSNFEVAGDGDATSGTGNTPSGSVARAPSWNAGSGVLRTRDGNNQNRSFTSLRPRAGVKVSSITVRYTSGASGAHAYVAMYARRLTCP